MKRKTILETIIFLYAILFIYTGISKLLDYGVFKENIAESSLLAPMAALIAWLVPILEFIITILLLIPRWRLKGMFASLALMLIFTVYVIGLLIFDPTLPCSCGGIIQQLSWQQHIIFNCVFIALASWGIVLQKREKKAQKTTWEINNYKTFPS